MSYKKSEKGQALVLIALAAVGLFGFAALSIDGGMVFSDKRHAQNAADTAALAAALARVRAQPPSDPDTAAFDAGKARAHSNGYGAPTYLDSTVEVNICNETGITCEGLPAWIFDPSTDPVVAEEEKSKYIRVKITSLVRMTFARIIGRPTFTNIVTAVSRAELGGPEPVFEGSALVALAPTGAPTIRNNGAINLDINNSGVFDNSTDDCSFATGGAGTINADTGYTIAAGGTHCMSGQGTALQGNIRDQSMFQSGTQIEYPPELDIPVPTINCPTPGRVTLDPGGSHPQGPYTVHPGSFTNFPTINNGRFTFVTGSYCFAGGLSIGGNAQVTANYADILISSGEFSVTSNLNCDYILVHISGGSGFNVTGNANVNCTNATFFASTGSVSLVGTGTGIYTAPTDGPHAEYANLLVYMPLGNTETLKISGNSGTTMTGSIIGVEAPVELHGNTGFVLNSSITGYTIDIIGNTYATINYVPEEQFTVLDPSAIGLTK